MEGDDNFDNVDNDDDDVDFVQSVLLLIYLSINTKRNIFKASVRE